MATTCWSRPRSAPPWSAARTGTAILTGPHLHNFADIAAHMRAAGALQVGADMQEVGDRIEHLLGDADARSAMVAAAHALVDQGRGALRRTLDRIAPELPPA